MAGLCLMVPVPFLDEWLAMRVRKHMVGAVARLHGRQYDAVDLAPLYRGPEKGCIGMGLGIAIALVMKPIKKLLRTIFFVFAIRTAANTVAETLLLGRAVDRHLKRGEFPDASTPKARLREARAMQVVFADLVAHTDLQLLRHVISSTFSGLGRAGKQATRAVSRLFRRKDSIPDEVHIEEVDNATERLDQALDNDEVRGFLAEFDARLDERMDVQLSRTALA